MNEIAGIVRTGRTATPAALRSSASLRSTPQGLTSMADRPAAGCRPAANEDGSVHAVSAGAIYNARDLRKSLAARGHVLGTADDAEVLAHLYEEAGTDLLRPPYGSNFGSVTGAFAFALWDAPRRRLILACDRIGHQPLYWRHGPEGLAFAGRLALLLECPDVPRGADRQAIGRFLRFGYIPAPATALEGIQKLPPAHYLVFDAAAGRLEGPTRYWDIPRGPAEAGLSPAEWRERLRTVLTEAVRSRLAAEAPVGVLLSGGLDSSTLLALAAEEASGPLRTFTLRFAERGWDESAYAREVARQFGTEHTEVPLAARSIESLDDLIRHHGEPFADSSILAADALLCEARRYGVRIALSGDGGDELFGGYPRHAALWLSERWGPRVRRLLARIGRRMRPHAGRKSRWNAARRFLAALDLEPLPQYLVWRSLFGEDDWGALLQPDFAAEVAADDPLDAWRGAIAGLQSRPWLDRAMAIDLADYLPNDGLVKVNIAATRHDLEVRSPMLDPAVVDLARRMPVDLKWRPRFGRPPQGKAILRDLVADRLPRAVLRRGKMGFGVPISRWLATDYAEWMRGILLDPSAAGRGLTRRETVEKMIAAHTARRADYGEPLWALLALELWFRAFNV